MARPPVVLPIAPRRVVQASLSAVVDSPQWRVAIRPWTLTLSLFDQLRSLRWTEGDASPLATAAKVALVGQLNVTATLLYRDPRVQQRWDSVLEVRQFLVDTLESSLGGERSQGPWVVKAPAGNTLGGEREYASAWSTAELRKAFPRIFERLRARYVREKTRRPTWTKDLAKALGVKPLTVLSYLERDPELQRCLDEARGKNKAIPERGVRSA